MILEQNTPEWFKWRIGKIGSSAIGPIIGDHTFQTKYSVFNEIMGFTTGFKGNHATQHGKKFEPHARKKFELRTGLQMPPICATHSAFPMLIASLDGFNQILRKVLEIKCPLGKVVIMWARMGKIAPHYIPQIYYQLAVTGADSLSFCVYHPWKKIFHIVNVKPDLVYQASLVEAALKFWSDHIRTGIAPALTDKDIKITDEPFVKELCLELKDRHQVIPKHRLDFIKERVVRMAGHPHVSCQGVQISTVIRKGNFHYHKLSFMDGKANVFAS